MNSYEERRRHGTRKCTKLTNAHKDRETEEAEQIS